jgi:hypothetical protein
MSHFTDVDITVRDLDALQAACQELDLGFETDAQARGYAHNSTHGDYVIKLKGPYDIAVNRQPDGNMTLTADLWRGHVEREVGSGFGRLKQLYGVHLATREARRRGLHVQRQHLADGRIRLQLQQV